MKENRSFEARSDEEMAYIRYEEDLLLGEVSLAGKKILDIGSNKPEFADYLKGLYPDTKVTSVDMKPIKGISARVEEGNLPFLNDSFDYVISHAGVTNNNAESIKLSIVEGLRVLRQNGEMRIGPIGDADVEENDEKKIEIVLKYLEELQTKHLISFKLIPVRHWRSVQGYDVVEYCLAIRKPENAEHVPLVESPELNS
ncbi:MAG: hypothetical protein G01um101466_799 [Parcubacteria group bacterium Gr01-1014_66]|nr:MAG: hypothetical protein G01um101466_799 [Parcubacteria group bacterium Gr01-1014_66]